MIVDIVSSSSESSELKVAYIRVKEHALYCNTLTIKYVLIKKDRFSKCFLKNHATCGDTRFTLALRATLHYMQHYITCNIALRATLYYAQHCITCNITLRATLHYVQYCIMCNIALRATLQYVQHCITCNIALHATLHYVQHCNMRNFVLV